MLKLLLLVGLAVGGYFAYKRFTQKPQDEWMEDPVAGAAEIHQTADVPAV